MLFSLTLYLFNGRLNSGLNLELIGGWGQVVMALIGWATHVLQW